MSIRRVLYLLLALAITGCSSKGYQRESGKWAWVWYDGHGRQVRYLPDVRGNVTVLSDTNYAVSADNVYLWGVKLPEAEPATFQLLTHPYSKDAARVYCGSVPITRADPNTFRILGGLLEPNFVSSAHVYEKVVGPIDAVPRDAPIVATQGWSRDEETCFFGPTALVGVDLGSFVILNNWYAKDAKQVYCGHRAIPEADVASFRVTQYLKAEDKTHKYYQGQVDK